MVEVGHQHGGRFEINHAIAAGLDLLQSRCVDGDSSFGRPRHAVGLGTSSSLHVAVQRDAAVFCVHRAVMSQQQITSHKGTSTLHALEWAFFGIYTGNLRLAGCHGDGGMK